MKNGKNRKEKNMISTQVDKNSSKLAKTHNKMKQSISVESATSELRRLFIILISIVVIICVFYIITLLVTRKNQTLKYQTNNEVSQISYTDILVSDVLLKDGSYYVLVKNSEDVYMNLYELYISSYISLEEHLPFYYVDLNDAFNQRYKSDQSNFSPENLKFKDTTLLKVSNHMIEASYDNNISISEHLKSLVAK